MLEITLSSPTAVDRNASTVIASAAVIATIGMPVRVAGLTIHIQPATFQRIPRPGEEENQPETILWSVLDRCVLPAERRSRAAHFGDNDIRPALVKIDVTFPYEPRVNASILDPLTANYPMLVRSLRALKIVRNDYDESAALSDFFSLSNTHLQELSLRSCGLTSVRALEGRCEYLRTLDLTACGSLRSLDGLEYHAFLEEVNASHTSITSVELLQTCPSLRKVNLWDCQRLLSLEGLEYHQYLQHVNVSDTPITSIEPLRTCPSLTLLVNISGCSLLPTNIEFPANVCVVGMIL